MLCGLLNKYILSYLISYQSFRKCHFLLQMYILRNNRQFQVLFKWRRRFYILDEM